MPSHDDLESDVSRKNLPMIVDISIANDGRQIYQVHETSNPVRDEMPISNFDKHGDSSSSTFSDDDANSSITSMTSSIKNKRSFDEIDADGIGADFNKLMKLSASGSVSDTSAYKRSRAEDENEVWGPDVETAFEEALRIIPKNGLSKIKVSGRSCGRNELISDYILQKTGKMRTRKQVSSHIQVIKNLKKSLGIIELINKGPTDPGSLRKFEEVFSKITFQKSIGDNQLVSSNVAGAHSAAHLMNINKKSNRRRLSYNVKNICEAVLKDFEMNCGNMKLSNLKSQEFDTNLKLKSNANISARFPGLFELFANGNNAIPSLHGMCKVNLPAKFNKEPKKVQDYNTHIDLSLKGLSVNESSWSVLTVIYSFGQEVVRLTDLAEVENQEISSGVKNADLKIKFAPEFWDAFFTSLEKTKDTVKIEDAAPSNDNDDKHKDVAIRAITIKQIIFKNNYGADGADASAAAGPTNIMKKDIRSIILWEFLRVQEPVKALTTIRRIHLINSVTNNAAIAAAANFAKNNFGASLAAPVAVNPMTAVSPMGHAHQRQPQQQLLPQQQMQQSQQYPYTPSTTPLPQGTSMSVHTTPVQSHNLVNLQQQEDLITRLESPIDMMTNVNVNGGNRIVLNRGLNVNGTPIQYPFNSPNFVTSNNAAEVTGQFNFGVNFDASAFNNSNNNNDANDGNNNFSNFGVNGPIPKKMFTADSANLLRQFEAGLAETTNNQNGAVEAYNFDFAASDHSASNVSSKDSSISFNSDFSLNSAGAASNASANTYIYQQPPQQFQQQQQQQFQPQMGGNSLMAAPAGFYNFGFDDINPKQASNVDGFANNAEELMW